jgi:nitroimidazol reductase NimA-like FMN-containing flavoprotein (pyridoxamine 5'-phosphate oxidase superfamily)
MENKPSAPTIEVLEATDCWRLLRGVSLGRLAVWVEDQPELFPLNFRTDQETIVFRTGPGTKFSAALQGKLVALEADGVNSRTNAAWSVVVKGHAAEVEQTEEFRTNVGQLLFPWSPGSKDRFVRITPTAITGRRFTIALPQTWEINLDNATRAGFE